jgi:transcriptional regulator with XRE-family HTH domain
MTPEELKTWRMDKGFTQQELAEGLGVSNVSVCRWETGVRAIPSFLPLALETLERRKKEEAGKSKKEIKKGRR